MKCINEDYLKISKDGKRLIVCLNKFIKKCIIPEGVEKIEEKAFWDCWNLEECKLPQSIIEIGDFAFENCYSLKHINIPVNISQIGDCAFFDCISLEKKEIPENTKCGSNIFGREENLSFSWNNEYAIRYITGLQGPDRQIRYRGKITWKWYDETDEMMIKSC